MARRPRLSGSHRHHAARQRALGRHDRCRPQGRAAVRVWLIVLFVLVAAMIALGGDAADRIGAVDHRMEAGDRGDPADGCRKLAGRIRQVSPDPAIPAGQPDMDLAGFKQITGGNGRIACWAGLSGLVWAAGFFLVFWLTEAHPGRLDAAPAGSWRA